MTLVDVCSRYTLLRALASKEMEEVAQVLWQVICEYGTMRILQSDNGVEFVSQVLRAMTTLYGIDHCLITVYNPRADGLVEGKNKQVGRIIRKHTGGSTGFWDLTLPATQLALNSIIPDSTASALSALMFGRAFNGFADFKDIAPFGDTEAAIQAREKFWQHFKSEVLPAISERNAEYQQQNRQQLDNARTVEVEAVGKSHSQPTGIT
jgi:transposase InsO family protein